MRTSHVSVTIALTSSNNTVGFKPFISFTEFYKCIRSSKRRDHIYMTSSQRQEHVTVRSKGCGMEGKQIPRLGLI